MPPAPPHKFARTSIEGWSRKRSVSPTSGSSKKASASNPSSHDVSSDEFVPRRSDDGLYYEEEYREEHIKYLLAMEVCHP